jgi:hypothetical protein
MKHYKLRRSRKPKSRNNRRQRTYRYRGGAAGGPAGAAAQIAAVDAAFNAAMGSTVTVIKKAIAQASHGSCKEAKDRALTLMGRLSPYSTDTVVTAAMLAADLAVTIAKSQAARQYEMSRHVLGDRPDVLKMPYEHSGNPKSQPTKLASPRAH